MMRTIRLVAWAAVAVLVVAMGAMMVLDPARFGPARFGMSKAPFAASIGGPFRLTTHAGGTLTDTNLAGRPYVIFFGFTNCPDICPTTMLELAATMKELGADADRVRFLFVSVDHENDTPAHLKEYLGNFDARITGLTGSAAEIATVARAYRVFYEKVKTRDGFTYNHTATTYLMGRDGQLFGTLAYQEDARSRLAKLKRLAAS